jgi:hypothetical protein
MTESAENASDTETLACVAKPRLRWYQFSLRSLLIFVTLCAIACSWLATWMQGQRRQFEAAKAFGHVVSWERHDGYYNYGTPSRRLYKIKPCVMLFYRKTFIGKCFDDDTLFNVTEIVCGSSFYYSERTSKNPAVSDANIFNIRYLKHLQRLSISGAQISDDGLKYIQTLPHLETLDLDNVDITDAGLVYLEGLSELKWLIITQTQVTKQGVEKLRRALPKCKIVSSFD